MIQNGDFAKHADTHMKYGAAYGHRHVAFGTWHRAYLIEFERSLQKADVALGGDGSITLPYWNLIKKVDNQVLPQMIRERFSAFPASAVDCEQHPTICIPEYVDDWMTKSDAEIWGDLRGKANEKVEERLLFGSITHRNFVKDGRVNLEGTLHNAGHTAVGGALGRMETAAWNPMFYLHHANIDRLYEAFLQIHGPELMNLDFRLEDSQLPSCKKIGQSNCNVYTQALEPFKHPTGEKVQNSDMFDTNSFGYIYDELPASAQFAISRQLQEQAQKSAMLNQQIRLEDLRPTSLPSAQSTIYIFIEPSQGDRSRFPYSDAKMPALSAFGSTAAASIPLFNEVEPMDLIVDVDDRFQEWVGRGFTHDDLIVITWVVSDQKAYSRQQVQLPVPQWYTKVNA